MIGRMHALVFSLMFIASTSFISGCTSTAARESTSEYVNDTLITSKLKSALFRDPQVSGFQVNIETFKGQVQLAGFVDSAAQKLKAEQIARSLPGVKAVTNSIVVKAQ